MIHPHLSPVTTDLSWKDLVLDKETLGQVEEIKTWLKQSSSAKRDKSLGKKLKAGYRTLFYGPPGTGKTTTLSESIRHCLQTENQCPPLGSLS